MLGAIAVMPVSAYTITPVSDGVRLYVENYWDAWCLATFPGYAADLVIDIGEIYGINNQRSKGNIEGEIRCHAIGYPIYFGGEPANPMNIVLDEPDSWPYHLAD